MPQQPAPRFARRGRTAPAVGIMLLLLLGLTLLALRNGAVGNNSAVPAVSPTPTIDPRLILHPHTVAIAAALTHGLRLHGTLAPDLPGINALDLALSSSQTRLAHGSGLRLEATMPGMPMLPVHATLPSSSGRYSGPISLPMFGTYRVAVEVSTTNGMVTGVLTVTIPLPGL